MNVGDVLPLMIYGHEEECEVLALHAAGTVDVERLRDGQCFRISGLRLRRRLMFMDAEEYRGPLPVIITSNKGE